MKIIHSRSEYNIPVTIRRNVCFVNFNVHNFILSHIIKAVELSLALGVVMSISINFSV